MWQGDITSFTSSWVANLLQACWAEAGILNLLSHMQRELMAGLRPDDAEYRGVDVSTVDSMQGNLWPSEHVPALCCILSYV